MRSLALATRHLDVDDAVFECRPRQQIARHSGELGFGPGIRDLDLAQSAVETVEVIGEKDGTSADELENLVHRVAELEPAILDADDSFVRRRETAVEPEHVSHL